ncbi:MAG: PepSY-associated TM helix domain-containing protein [Salinivirgaceae bacterium]|nr:PepSY-associated TM helix domain-containing protein [Salinivirgaceae bacterium]
MKIRKLNRATHRDLGYIFFAMSVIYGLSGISLNHIKDWNPNYIVENSSVKSDLTQQIGLEKENVMAFLETIHEKDNYKKYYFPNSSEMKIFIQNGSIIVNTKTGEAQIEKLRRRPVFHEFNWLHYNHAKRLFTWFADIFAVSLILLAITGLFMVKGKNGITRRGAWLTAIGIIIPLVLYFMYI